MHAKTFRIFCRQRPFFHVLPPHHVHRLALAQQQAVLDARYFVSEPNHRSTRCQQRGLHRQLIVIPRRRAIPYMHIHNRDAATLALHLLVVEPHAANQLHSADLEPDEVVRVIHHAHLIGLSVSHPHPRLTRPLIHLSFAHPDSLSDSRRCLSYLSHTGLRFSRNDATPSRKSCVDLASAFAASAAAIAASSNALFCPASNRFVAANDCGLFAINVAANSRVRATSNSGCTTSFTSPNRYASSLVNTRPVSSRSRARLSPTCNVRNTDTSAGTNPIFTSV